MIPANAPRWIYRQSTGKLYLSSSPTFKYACFAGQPPYVNNPAAQGSQGKGPLPCGLYQIMTFKDQTTNSGHRLAFAARLVASPSNIMFGRDGFFIHGMTVTDVGKPVAARTSSNGCIIAPHDVRRIVADSKVTLLEVVA